LRRIHFIVCFAASISVSSAQINRINNPVLIDPALNERQNQFLNNQSEALLNQAARVISGSPPSWPEPAARPPALLLLDAVFHDVYAPWRPAVQNFLKMSINKAVDQIAQTEISDGARIWKLYNHGFVIRTKSVTIGFDLVSGKSVNVEGFLINDEGMRTLINECDVLFISHRHSDHAEEAVAQSFVDQNKPVVAPPGLWKGRPVYSHLTHLKRIAHTVQQLSIKSGRQQLNVVIYPGHQGEDIENNVALVVTPEGLSFAQMGDQSNSDDFAWIDAVAQHHAVDVLMPNCWTTDIVRVAKGFKPVVIMTGHENEMGHTIDHREPYWLTYQRREGSDRFGGSLDEGYDTPLIVMTWGESYHFSRDNFTK